MMIYILLALGLLLLAFGGDVMVDGSVSVAKRFKVSPLLIGLTLVGFGTSTPELVTSLLAVFDHSDGIAVGNVIGSNIANILLVLGAAAVIMPVKVDIKSFKRDGAFLALSTVALGIVVLFGSINFWMGALLVALLVGYIAYSYISDHKRHKEEASDGEPVNMAVALCKTFGGIAMTVLGAKLLVANATILARNWGVSEMIIGLTVVAIGTSLPELATSVMSSIKGHNDVAFGNVVGSNIYNALFILGVTALFMPVVVSENVSLDAFVMTLVTAALIGIAFWKKQFSRPMGFVFLILYAAYNYFLFS